MQTDRFALHLPRRNAIVVGAGGIATVLAHDIRSAAAHDTLATHPLVGIWRTAVVNAGDTSFSSLSTFHADGTYSEVLPEGLVLTGVWHPTGDHTADLTAYLNYFIGDRLVAAEVRLTVVVEASGTALTEDGTLVGLYDDGTVAIAVESPATGVRLGVLPVEPLGTPVLPPDAEAAGTPVP